MLKMVLRKSLCVVTVMSCQASMAADPRPFSVRDAVEMAYFGNIVSSSPDKSYDDGAVSPDGRFAMKITHRAVLPEGLTEGTIWLFDVADVISSIEDREATIAAPEPLVRMSAAINGYTADWQNRGNVVLHPRWSDDGKSVFFLGRDGRENRRLYRVDVASRSVTSLSPANRDVFAYSASGRHVAFLAGSDVDSDELWRSSGGDIADIVVGTGSPLMSLLFPNFLGYATSEPLELEVWRVRGESAEPVKDETSGDTLQVVSPFYDADVSISPDGRQAVTVTVAPAEQGDSPTDGSYRIIDLESGKFRDSADLDAAGLEWTPFAPKLPSSGMLQFDVSEGLNQPPVLVATNRDSGESRVVFDPNPQLADISLLPVTTIEWQDRHGRNHVGGLLLPADFEVGQRYPLVIQTHGFDPNRFFRVGYSDTASAGRPLASRDMVVLQVQEADPNMDDPPIDIEKTGLDVYLAAIDELAARGMIDAGKVGISGYSFSALTVATAISRAPERFSAAVIANGDPLTMTGYFSYVDTPLEGQTEEFFTGAAPFDDGLQAWQEKSPSMNVSAITAPVLVSAADPWHLLSLWDWYAALRYQDKPVDLQYIRSGQHNITKPLHKLAHQETIVDWFDFWLNDHEDDDPQKVDQYRRWREWK